MSDGKQNVKPPTLAALRNVFGCMELVKTVQLRAPSLPNIGVMHGPSGYGKSYGSIYVQNKTGAVRVEVGESWNKKTFVSAILREAGVLEPRGNTADLMRHAIQWLGDEPNRPLIVDEADKLVDKGLIELVREIADHALIPVLLIGEEMLPNKLARFERVHNRVLHWYPAQPCDLADCRELAKVHLHGIEIDDDLLDEVRAKGQGVARRVSTTLADMRGFAVNNAFKRLTRENWQGRIFTGEAPVARSSKLRIGGRAA